MFTQNTFQEFVEYFQRNDSYDHLDVMGMAALGLLKAKETLVPEVGVDPAFYSRRFAAKPNRYFDANKDGDLILACIHREVEARANALAQDDPDWAVTLINKQMADAHA